MRMSLVFLLAAMVLAGSPGQAQEVALADPQLVTIRHQVLLPFLEALKNGDVSEIKRHMSLELYERNRVLLDENMEYPAFLRNYYKDISFRVVKAEKDLAGEGIVFHVSFDSTGGDSSIHELKLSKEQGGNQQSDAWVIKEF
jgi:hypothetical protein